VTQSGSASSLPADVGGGGATPADTSSIADSADGSSSATDNPSAEGTVLPQQNAGGIVGQHGALRVAGNRVVDQQGKSIQLRGMSWFWSQWTDFYVAKNVDVMVDDWKSTVVRAALGVENEDGYLEQPAANVAKVRAVVDRAIARGVYVIIDWHDHHAQDHKAQALDFFEQMAKAYGKQPHVIFEIYNEPMNVSWPVVKSYAEQVIRTIRAAGSNNLVIVGTPNWSQDVDVAASNRIQSDPNVAYTLHFYANTHRQFLRDKAKTALDRGIALFVTEWGTCSADGNGAVDENETRSWLSFMQTNGISWANWALNNKPEACSAVRPAAPSVGPWRDDQLTPSGLLVKKSIP
jgi:endoglucanase